MYKCRWEKTIVIVKATKPKEYLLNHSPNLYNRNHSNITVRSKDKKNKNNFYKNSKPNVYKTCHKKQIRTQNNPKMATVELGEDNHI